jgi:hypothetical protein
VVRYLIRLAWDELPAARRRASKVGTAEKTAKR